MTSRQPRTESFERGLATRREVLGPESVDAALARSNDFNWPMQQLVTEHCWNDIWNRPGLDRRSRSLLNLGMLCALNRSTELKGHVRGALRNGLKPKEIQEALLQVAIYCGVPAAMEAFRVASEVLSEEGVSVE